MKSCRIIALALVLVLVAACEQVQVASTKEDFNENGFELNLGYVVDTDLLLGKIDERQTLFDANGRIRRTLHLRYWEWFQTGTVPQQKPQGMSQNLWDIFQPHAGQKIVYSDHLRSGPGQVVGQNVNAPNFTVVIEREHTLYVGGAIQGEAAGNQMNFGGRSGILNQDPDGNAPTYRLVEGQQQMDNSQDFVQKNNAMGQVTRIGSDVLQINIRSESVWQRELGNQNYSVEWNYRRAWDGSEITHSGTASDVRPQPYP